MANNLIQTSFGISLNSLANFIFIFKDLEDTIAL